MSWATVAVVCDLNVAGDLNVAEAGDIDMSWATVAVVDSLNVAAGSVRRRPDQPLDRVRVGR